MLKKEDLLKALRQAGKDNKNNKYQGFDLKCMLYAEVLGYVTSSLGCFDEFFDEVENIVKEKAGK